MLPISLLRVLCKSNVLGFYEAKLVYLSYKYFKFRILCHEKAYVCLPFIYDFSERHKSHPQIYSSNLFTYPKFKCK